MPFHKEIIINDFIKIILWRIIPGELNSKNLNQNDKNLFMLKNSKILKEQFLGVRFLLKKEDPNLEIHYNSMGKPFLNKNIGISISHSNEMLALGISKKTDIGIDIQEIKEKIFFIQEKFINQKKLINNKKIYDLEFLTKIWTSKEAIYKLIGEKNISFSKDLFIDLKIPNSNKCTGYLYKNDEKVKFNINYFKLENYILTYATRAI